MNSLMPVCRRIKRMTFIEKKTYALIVKKPFESEKNYQNRVNIQQEFLKQEALEIPHYLL